MKAVEFDAHWWSCFVRWDVVGFQHINVNQKPG